MRKKDYRALIETLKEDRASQTERAKRHCDGRIAAENALAKVTKERDDALRQLQRIRIAHEPLREAVYPGCGTLGLLRHLPDLRPGAAV